MGITPGKRPKGVADSHSGADFKPISGNWRRTAHCNHLDYAITGGAVKSRASMYCTRGRSRRTICTDVVARPHNAAVPAQSAWDVAVWVEGWEGGVFAADEEGRPRSVDAGRVVIADPGKGQVTIRVPRSAFPEGDPGTWGYLGVLLSQDGFPSAGVWRVRDVLKTAEQWRLGGAPDDTNHTRIIDVAWPAPAEPSQEFMLSNYSPSQEPNMDNLSPDDFAGLQMVYP